MWGSSKIRERRGSSTEDRDALHPNEAIFLQRGSPPLFIRRLFIEHVARSTRAATGDERARSRDCPTAVLPTELRWPAGPLRAEQISTNNVRSDIAIILHNTVDTMGYSAIASTEMKVE